MSRLMKNLPYIVIILVIFIRLSSILDSISLAERRTATDFNHYIKISENMLGKNNTLPPRTYQYPFLYPMMIIPGLIYENPRAYILILDTILSIIIFIISLFFIKKYIIEPIASLSAFALNSLNIFLLPIKGFGYPILICILLFIIMLYFLIRHHNIKIPSICYALMVAASFSALFLAPFIILFLVYIKKDSIKRSLLFFIPGFIVFMIHSISNILMHGLSFRGALGGYTSSIKSPSGTSAFWLNWEERLLSLFYYLEPSLILMIILLTGLIVFICYKNNKKFELKLSLLLFGNMIFYLLVPGMLWNLDYIAWRYLCFMSQGYLIILLIIFIKIYFKKTMTDRDRGWRAGW